MFDDILLFVKVVNHAGFVAAAQNVGIAQSTVSRRVQVLEKQLGVQLIKRNTRDLELTEKGRIIFENFRNIEQTLQRLLNPIYSHATEVSGSLHVILPQAFALFAVTPYLGSFVRKNPGLKLLVSYHFREIDLIKENCDLAITTFMPKQTTQTVKTIYKSKIIGVCSQAYIDNYGLIENFSEFDQHLAVGIVGLGDTQIKTLTGYNERTNTSHTTLNPERLRVNSFEHAKGIVKSGEALAGLPEDLVRAELASGELVRVLPEYNFGHMSLYQLRNIDNSDLRFKAFDQFIKQCLQRLLPEASYDI